MWRKCGAEVGGTEQRVERERVEGGERKKVPSCTFQVCVRGRAQKASRSASVVQAAKKQQHKKSAHRSEFSNKFPVCLYSFCRPVLLPSGLPIPPHTRTHTHKDSKGR